MHDMPMLAAVCLGMKELVDRKFEVLIVGATHLDDLENVPSMMRLAASIMHIPGFDISDIERGL